MATAETKRAETVPGSEAEKPQEIPARGWVQIAKRGWKEAQTDQVPLLAAGIAYYTFLAIFPAIVAAVLIYGFFADPSTIADEVSSALKGLPPDITTLVVNQMRNVAATQGGAGFGAIISIVLALWSASGGVTNLMTAINVAYDETDDRSFVKKRLTALGLLVGAIVVVLLMLGLVAVLPAVLKVFGTSGPLYWLLQVARWVAAVAVVSVALAVLYRIAPDRDAPKIKWVSVGAVLAAVLIILASVGLSFYTSGLAGGGNPYAKTYGALAGIIVFLLWLFIGGYAILLGAEINSESEQQTIADTTKGAPMPLGQRNAVKADSVPDPSEDGFEADGSGKDRDAGTNHSDQHSSSTKDTPMAENTPTTTGAVTTGTSVSAASTTSGEQSTGDLIRAMSQDLSTLVRDEIRLAQAEVGQKAKAAGIGIGAFGGAGVVALYGLGVLIAAAVLGFANIVSPWLAALIVAVILFLVAAGAALFGKKELSQASPPVPTQTIASVKTDVAEIKESIKK